MAQLIPTLSGKSASAFGFGTMQFGVGTPDADCGPIYDACRAAGINVFDTAFAYNDGASERALGRLVAKEREDVLVMSKCAHPGPSDRATILDQFDRSRSRLNMDVIDVYFLHRWDDETPLEETLSTLAGLKSDGSIRSVGVSNFAAWQVMKARAVAEKLALNIDVIQPMYNLVKRQAEVELFPMCRSEGIAVTPYSPLGGGLLTGKYRVGGAGRITENPEYAARYAEDWTHEVARKLADFAGRAGRDPATLAVAWVAHNPDVTAPLISGRTMAQLAPSLDAVGLAMEDDFHAEMCRLTRTPPPATDRLEEQG